MKLKIIDGQCADPRFPLRRGLELEPKTKWDSEYIILLRVTIGRLTDDDFSILFENRRGKIVIWISTATEEKSKELTEGLTFRIKRETATRGRYIKTIRMKKIEWKAFDRNIMDDSEKSALPSCCANISALRDQILLLKRRNGRLYQTNKDRLLEAFEWTKDGHDMDRANFATLYKLIDQTPK